MIHFSDELLQHGRIRAVQCYLCRRVWEEQWVGVRLTCTDEPLGSLCPLCVQDGPRRTAERLRAECLPSTQGPSAIPEDGLDDFIARTVRLRVDTVLLCEAARQLLERSRVLCERAAVRLDQLRQATRTVKRPATPAVVIDPAFGFRPELDERGEMLRRLEQSPAWPVELPAVIRAERMTFLQRFACLGYHCVSGAVDDRYERFLSAERRGEARPTPLKRAHRAAAGVAI